MTDLYVLEINFIDGDHFVIAPFTEVEPVADGGEMV